VTEACAQGTQVMAEPHYLIPLHGPEASGERREKPSGQRGEKHRVVYRALAEKEPMVPSQPGCSPAVWPSSLAWPSSFVS